MQSKRKNWKNREWIEKTRDWELEEEVSDVHKVIYDIYIYIYIYRVSQEECARLREGVPYVKVYQYNPKHLCPKLNGYGDNGQRSLKL